MHQQVERDRPVFDLLRAVPAEQIEHRGVRVDLVQVPVAENPVPHVRGEVLEGRYEGEPLEEVRVCGGRRQFRPVSEHPSEDPFGLQGVRSRVKTLGEQVLQDLLVRLGVHRFLADEAAYVLPQPVVGDQWQCLLEGAHEPAFEFGEHEVEYIEGVGREGLTRQPVQRGGAPVEGDVPGLQHQVVVVDGLGRTFLAGMCGSEHGRFLFRRRSVCGRGRSGSRPVLPVCCCWSVRSGARCGPNCDGSRPRRGGRIPRSGTRSPRGG